MKEFQVTIAGSGKTFSVDEDEAVLAAALRQGVMLPYSCKNGTCGSCRGTVINGSVHYPDHAPEALEEGEAEAGFALLCQAHAKSDLVVDAREIEAVRDIQVRTLPARVVEKEFLSDNVVRLVLRLPLSQRLQFLAGQYVDVFAEGGKRRAFSIASCPSLENEIELHIRHVEGGGFTSYVFEELKVRDIMRFEGPLGTFFVRNDRPERPMIMMGGGTGFAPLKSMIENLLEHGDEREIHLFWGARSADELYMDARAASWAGENPHITYRRALSDEGSSTGENDYHGFVHDAVLDSHPDLSSFDVYMSGPPAMIDAAKHAFLDHGLPEGRLFYDSFEFGLDVPVTALSKRR